MPLHGVAFRDANTGTAVGNSDTILRTTDGGNHWGPQTSETTDHLWDVSFSDANNGTAVGEGGTIVRTTDGGINWIVDFSGTFDILYDVSFSDANIGTVVGDIGTILRTTGSGRLQRPPRELLLRHDRDPLQGRVLLRRSTSREV